MYGLEDDGVPLATALAIMYPKAAATLIECGARVDNVIFRGAADRLDLLSRDIENDALRPDAPRCVVPWPKMSSDPREVVAQAFAYGCMCGQMEVAVFLLGEGVPIGARAKPDFGRPTALHLAAWGGQEEIVRFLVERGADLAIPDDAYDATPAGWAGEAGHAELSNFLRAASPLRRAENAGSEDRL